jgi:lysozyme
MGTALHPEALALICEREGYLQPLNDGTDRVRPYYCPAAVPTIGFGSIWRMDGTRVEITDPPITRAEATALMRREIEGKCLPAVSRLITVSLHPLSTGALVSFVFNLGAGALKSSGLRRAVNEQRWEDVPAEFAKWRLAGGRVLRGLELRRAAEAQMFLRGVRVNLPAARRDVGQETPWTTTWRQAA